jgi:hypothetical protein
MNECYFLLTNMKQFIDLYIDKTYCPDDKIIPVFEKTIQNINSIESNESNPCNQHFKKETNYLHFHKVVLNNYLLNNISVYPNNYNGLCALKNFSLHLDDLIDNIKHKIDVN